MADYYGEIIKDKGNQILSFTGVSICSSCCFLLFVVPIVTILTFPIGGPFIGTILIIICIISMICAAVSGGIGFFQEQGKEQFVNTLDTDGSIEPRWLHEQTNQEKFTHNKYPPGWV